jgi:photosystem II stability/assembly factor-like uncharacterized protein
VWEAVPASAPKPRALRWSALESGTKETLTAVFGTSTADVWIGGDGGTVLRTRDHGRSFEHASLGEPVVAIWGAEPEDVWILGKDRVHRVQRGGTLATLSVEGQRSSSVWGSSALDVWIASGVLVHTVDGGVTWSQVEPSGPVHGTGDVWTSSPLDVWATVPFGVVHSVDGGRTWASASLRISMEDDFRVRGSARDVWIVGYTLGPSRSTDGGATWHADGPPPPPGLPQPAFYGDLWSAGGGWAWAATLNGLWVRPGRTPWLRVLDARDLVALWASGPTDAWAVGKDGRILHFS